MAKSTTSSWRLIGWNIQGDLGPVTTYTSQRGALVVFPRSPPLAPPSPGQQAMRNVWRAAAQLWRQLPNEQRARWKNLAERARLRMHGYALFVYYVRTADDATLSTLERRTGITVR